MSCDEPNDGTVKLPRPFVARSEHPLSKLLVVWAAKATELTTEQHADRKCNSPRWTPKRPNVTHFETTFCALVIPATMAGGCRAFDSIWISRSRVKCFLKVLETKPLFEVRVAVFGGLGTPAEANETERERLLQYDGVGAKKGS